MRSQNLKNLGRYAIFSKRLPEQFRGKVSSKLDSSKATKQTEKMVEVINTAQEILLNVSSVFPFMMFPDSLKVDRQKVMLIHRSFFGVAQIINIQVEDLQAIEADIGPFLGSLSITTKQYFNTVNDIHMLSRKDTINAQRLLQGFVVAQKQELDYSSIEKDKLITLLEDLGRGDS